MKDLVEISVSIRCTDEDIDDIMCAALEGGVNYWCDKAVVEGEYLGEYASEQISRNGSLKFHTVEPFDDEETEWYVLDKEKFMTGLKLFLEDPVRLAGAICRDGLDPCNIDAGDADTIIQLALFGDIIYG